MNNEHRKQVERLLDWCRTATGIDSQRDVEALEAMLADHARLRDQLAVAKEGLERVRELGRRATAQKTVVSPVAVIDAASAALSQLDQEQPK